MGILVVVHKCSYCGAWDWYRVDVIEILNLRFEQCLDGSRGFDTATTALLNAAAVVLLVMVVVMGVIGRFERTPWQQLCLFGLIACKCNQIIIDLPQDLEAYLRIYHQPLVIISLTAILCLLSIWLAGRVHPGGMGMCMLKGGRQANAH